MAEEKDIALIESYLLGELVEEEKATLEGRLATDDDFKKLFEDVQALTEGLGRLQHKQLLQRMDQLESGLRNPLEARPKTRTIFWTVQRMAAVFAGLAIVALASWYLFSDSPQPDGQALYTEYFAAYENVMVPITRSDEALTLVDSTFQAYELGDFGSAVGLFDKLLKEDKRPFVRFYAGIAYMAANQSEQAEVLFSGLINEGGDFVRQARWYQALNFLKKEEYNESILLLNELAASANSYQEKAQELLRQLK